ncbi:hypothetical protein AMJ87_00435 [candidate division WOR_3 bacterium SM23_60]|uniref:PorV/PorQ family protein n=1 Tax=candidate division WOR_3 bacterium SM23_60 TaxID=1703780 RepID=A0A0S8GM37_UNCW3|nr:MAG: hypothetical protein AMJ87_00435 [candidate division WOR_3 bacterium SM23_60]
MAYAFSAVSDNACANYYNSAGLAFLQSPMLTATYLGHLTGLAPNQHYAYFAVCYPLVSSAWGFDFIFFTPGEAEKRDSLGIYLGTELVWRIAPKISYARRLADRLSLGLALKFVLERYLEGRWFGDFCYVDAKRKYWAFDFSLLCKPVRNLSLGAVLHNIGPDASYASDPLPRLGRLGIAYVPLDNRYIKCTFTSEITKILVDRREFRDTWKAIGLELRCYNVLSLRGGYFHDYASYRDGLTFGLGLDIMNIEFDVGIDEFVYDWPTQNRTISLSYRFN